jgi:hypothetical protein
MARPGRGRGMDACRGLVPGRWLSGVVARFGRLGTVWNAPSIVLVKTLLWGRVIYSELLYSRRITNQRVKRSYDREKIASTFRF